VRPGPPRATGAAAGAIEALLARCRWPPGRAVTAAVSGGADSLALLVLATRAGLEVTAIHVDHGLRDGSEREAEVVAEAAARFGARFEARRAAVAEGPNLEARSRAARYAVLPVGVMTGHTADDRAETMLLNLLRGAALDGLSAMGPRKGVQRPLLALRRGETSALCAELGLRVVHDPTNDDVRLRRNAVRHLLLPLMAEISGRDPVPVLVRQAALLADDAALLDELAAGVDPTDATTLAGAPLPLARRAVRTWLRAGADAEAHPPSSAEVARVLAVARGDAVACELPGGRRVDRRRGRLRVEAVHSPLT
jgi:tRNA(Ile)-lysidine synthase